MDEQENNRKDKKNMNERGSYVEDDECPDPREEQNKRESKKYKPHGMSPSWSAIISRFLADTSASHLPIHSRWDNCGWRLTVHNCTDTVPAYRHDDTWSG
jgi:hypothetical protein